MKAHTARLGVAVAVAVGVVMGCVIAGGAPEPKEAAAGEGTPDVLPVTAHGFPSPLHTEGRHLKDASGKVVILRGVNKPGFVDVPDGWWNLPGGSLYSGLGIWNPDAVKANLDEIKRWGCNVIRLHTCIEWWKENPDTFADQWRNVTYPKSFREMYKDVIRWAGQRGLYVIVDFYNMKRTSGQESLPWPPHSEHRDVIGSREEFLRLWETVARELGPFPHVLFELYNEPHGDQEARAEWFAFTQQAIDRIRAITDNVVVVQWDYGCWVNLAYPPPGHPAATLDWIETHPLRGSNILYSTHLYRDSGGGGSFATKGQVEQVKCWERGDLLRALRLVGVERVVAELDKPLIVGEVGAHMRKEGEELERELAWFGNILEILDEWEVGYVAWSWHPEEHLVHGMIEDGDFFAGPNAAGRVFMEAAAGR